MQPLEGNPTHDCWTVAFGNSSSSTDRVVSSNLIGDLGYLSNIHLIKIV